jgi:hypothetical protein
MFTARHKQARDLAAELMQRFGLRDWRFRFNRRRRCAGLSVFPHLGQPGRIERSVYCVDLNDWPLIEVTVRHELVHALTGPDAGHGPVWRSHCGITGANATRTCRSATMPLGPWQFRSPMKHRGYRCSACGSDLTFRREAAAVP